MKSWCIGSAALCETSPGTLEESEHQDETQYHVRQAGFLDIPIGDHGSVVRAEQAKFEVPANRCVPAAGRVEPAHMQRLAQI